MERVLQACSRRCAVDATGIFKEADATGCRRQSAICNKQEKWRDSIVELSFL